MFVNRPTGSVIDIPATARNIQNWINSEVRAISAESLVIGLSGGVDSSLIAALCQASATGAYLNGLILKCGNNSQDERDARDIASRYDIRLDEIDLRPVYEEMQRRLSHAMITSRLSNANLQSRLRMCALYAKANASRGLVVGTTNLTEAVLGYYTKYGDGGVDIEPIEGLLKREVREMAAHMGVPDHIVNKTPSAGLWSGQTDESELGVTYDQLDEAIYQIITGNPEPERGRQYLERAANVVRDMYRRNAHKRRQPNAALDAVSYVRGE